MLRRDFLALSAKAGALAVVVPRLLAAEGDAFPAGIAELYQKVIVIDSLCAPALIGDNGQISADALHQVRDSGITAVNHTISDQTFEGTIEMLAQLQASIDEYPDLYVFIRKHSDIARAKRDRKVGILPGFQFTEFLESDLARIAEFRRLDVRIMQLTYNLRGKFGDGCLVAVDSGLTGQGRLACAQMNQLGIAVDTSHSGIRTTADALAVSSKPILISHAGCAAVSLHPRNKPDDLLKSLADRGGYVGIYLMPYLVESPTIPTREHVMAHLLHAINVCGADHVGIGSDGSIEAVHLTQEQKKEFDEDIARRKKLGIGAPGEDRYPYVPDLNGPQHMEIIAWELQKCGQPAAVIEKVLGANFHRVLGDIWGTA
ncbi:MAG TPA: membrane dipeptidase [Candidatus Koribacter sp.]|jgi:membrane dipeptidase